MHLNVYHLKCPFHSSENHHGNEPQVKLSKFSSLRPEHVKLVGSTPRDVCVCQYHANFFECCKTLHDNVPGFPNYADVTNLLVCEKPTQDCWFKKCKGCSTTKTNKKLLRLVETADKRKIVKCMRWMKDDTTNRTQKQAESGTIAKLMSYFGDIYPKFLQHKYVRRIQAECFTRDRTTVAAEANSNVALLQIDFAENYKCEAQDEVQAAHYNQKQVRKIRTLNATA